MTAKKNELLSKSEALKLSWKNRKNYKNIDRSKGSIYNTWRSIVYNSKGKKIGFPNDWNSFDYFKSIYESDWIENSVLVRKDKNKPYSVENCLISEKGSEVNNRYIDFEYNGETKKLIDWCLLYSLNYNGVKKRYYTGKNYSKHEILFGKIKKPKRECTDIKQLSYQKAKDKVSKMLSTYKNKDKKRGYFTDITHEYLHDTFSKKCIYCGCPDKIGLDRIDNKKGHTIENTVPCCQRCNTTRNDNFSFDEMIQIGKLINKIDSNRKIL